MDFGQNFIVMQNRICEQTDLMEFLDHRGGYEIPGAPCFTDLPGSTGRLMGRLGPIVWEIQRTVTQSGPPAGDTPPDMGGTSIVQKFLPSSPSKKVRTSFKISDKREKPTHRRCGGFFATLSLQLLAFNQFANIYLEISKI